MTTLLWETDIELANKKIDELQRQLTQVEEQLYQFRQLVGGCMKIVKEKDTIYFLFDNGRMDKVANAFLEAAKTASTDCRQERGTLRYDDCVACQIAKLYYSNRRKREPKMEDF